MAGSGFSDRLRLLQERDKDLRESRHRHTDIETAKAVRGTCQDMCPEIERLFREETNQLSPLEMSKDGKPDPHAMVKEYRRAGADQSEPLSHEMRPPDVLQRSMDYLVCNIMDRITSEPNIAGDWYDFLWSRTRAIRKDITQQHLCDSDSVDLLEKCARFHVFCAGTMIEEDISVFDPKINDENLRKCIQSLKDFYHDLHLKGGQVCPNESEFRSYDILLNLADSDILREVAHLRKNIRDSPAVLFAINCHFALASNNFVKFFRLVASASFLQSCLLHRYFNRIRVTAVRIMKKSFTVPNQTESFSAEEFCHLLGFDDLNQVAAFCRNVGLTFEDSFIHLTREKYSCEDPTLPKTRSRVLVESKRITSIGEVVHGRSLPENPYTKYPLHSSFNEDGSLKENALETLPTQSTFSSSSNLFASKTLFGARSSNSSFNFTGFGAMVKKDQFLEKSEPLTVEQIEALANIFCESIIEEVTEDIVEGDLSDALEDLKEEVRKQEDIIKSLAEKIIDIGSRGLLQNVVKSVVEEETQIQRAKDKRTMILNLSDLIAGQMIDELIRDLLQELTDEHWKELIRITSYKLCGDLMRKVCLQELRTICCEVHAAAVARRETMIKLRVQERNLKISRKFFDIWLTKYKKSERLRQLRESFPASCMGSGNVIVPVIPCPVKSLKRRSLQTPTTPSFTIPSSKRKSTGLEGGSSSKAIRSNSSRKPSPPVQPICKSPRLASHPLIGARETIALRTSTDPENRMKLLQFKIQEAKKSEESSKQITDCIARSMAYLESYDS